MVPSIPFIHDYPQQQNLGIKLELWDCVCVYILYVEMLWNPLEQNGTAEHPITWNKKAIKFKPCGVLPCSRSSDFVVFTVLVFQSKDSQLVKSIKYSESVKNSKLILAPDLLGKRTVQNLYMSRLFWAQERDPELHGTAMLAALAGVHPTELLSTTFIYERALPTPSPKDSKQEEKQYPHVALPRMWPEAGLHAWNLDPSQ